MNRYGKQDFLIYSDCIPGRDSGILIKIKIPEYCCGIKLDVNYVHNQVSFFNKMVCEHFLYYPEIWINRIIDVNRICKKAG